jgi:hypothetical protein
MKADRFTMKTTAFKHTPLSPGERRPAPHTTCPDFILSYLKAVKLPVNIYP